MKLKLPERGESEGRLVLDQGQLAGHSYRVEIKICANPVCECKTLALQCFPETPGEATLPQAPLTLELDLGQRVLDKPRLSETTPASVLAKAVMDEMTSEQWGHLWRFFFALKIFYTESANLDKLDADFPPDAIEGQMVGYYEILPYSRPVNFNAEGCEWFFDDQYCLRPDCSCRAAFLQCFRIVPQNPGAAPEKPSLSFRYHYDTQRVDHVEQSGSGLSPETALDSLRQARPNFDAFLSSRHTQLRHLYRLFLERHRVSTRRSRDRDADAQEPLQDWASEPVRLEHKPGRNDPCPCGSGKKYKKCCGRN